MKPRTCISLMTGAAAMVVVMSILMDVPGVGFAAFMLSGMPILAIVGLKPLWRPWFMEGIEIEEPDMTVFFWQALSAELIMFAGLEAGHGAWMLGFRVVATFLQFATIGRFKTDHSPAQPHEIRRKSTPRPDPGISGKSDI